MREARLREDRELCAGRRAHGPFVVGAEVGVVRCDASGSIAGGGRAGDCIVVGSQCRNGSGFLGFAATRGGWAGGDVIMRPIVFRLGVCYDEEEQTCPLQDRTHPEKPAPVNARSDAPRNDGTDEAAQKVRPEIQRHRAPALVHKEQVRDNHWHDAFVGRGTQARDDARTEEGREGGHKGLPDVCEDTDEPAENYDGATAVDVG